MAEITEMKKYLYQLLSKVPGLNALVISDRDGVPIIKAANENAPELALRSNYLATVGMATDQAGKLGLGKNKTIICMYGNNQVVHLNRHPLMVTLIATNEANTGMLIQLESELSVLVQDLKATVETNKTNY